MAGPKSDEKSGRILREAMVSVFPQLANAGVDYCWGGLADMSMDRLVHAGEQDGLFHSVGYPGHGVQIATHMGKQMADYMDGVLEANPWRDIPFKRISGHLGPPWFLPFAGPTTSSRTSSSRPSSTCDHAHQRWRSGPPGRHRYV